MTLNIESLSVKPRVLFYDIETAKFQYRAEFYQLKQYSSYLPSKGITRLTWFPCIAWKWQGEPFIASTSVLRDKETFYKSYWNDRVVVQTLVGLISQADVIIAHNGDKFDWRKLIWRCAVHGINPPPKPVMIDTLKAAKKEWGAEAYDLRFLAKHLGVTEKETPPNWDTVSEGNEEAIQQCEEYCRGDIRTLEGVYEKLRPYMTNHPNLNVIHKVTDATGLHEDLCPKCLSPEVHRRGFLYTRAGRKQRYHCQSCGGHHTGKKTIPIGDYR